MFLRRLLNYWRNFLHRNIHPWFDEKEDNVKELPGDVVRVSTCLSEVMADIGVTQEIVELRRKVGIERAALTSLQWLCEDNNEIVYNFGSQSEGSTTTGLFSDLDGIYMRTDVEVIKDVSEWQEGMAQVLVTPSDFSGYRRLVILSLTEPCTETTLAKAAETYGKVNIERKEGKLFLLNSFLLPQYGVVTHGPAVCQKEDFGNRTEDIVNAFICRYLPEEIEHWLHRVDDSQWPSLDVKEYVKNHAYFLVPVGHKQSKSKDLEYRVSCSFAERKLMFSMNKTQIRCLIVMKMLVKTHINNKLNGILKSYFCKTALFYTIEETQNQGWVGENVVQYVIKCLHWLENCFSENKMPHYFMPNLNMLEGRFDSGQRKAVVNELRTLRKEYFNSLLEIRFDQVGNRLANKLSLQQRGDEVPIETPKSVQGNISRFLLDAHHKYCRFSVPVLLAKCGGFDLTPEKSILKIKEYLEVCDLLRDDELYQLSIKGLKFLRAAK